MPPHEFSCLYDWSPNSKLSYGDFLRAKQSEGSIRYEIDNHDKELIATNQQLSEHGIEILSIDPERGFTMLSQGVPDTAAGQEGSAEIAGRFHWGFSEVLIAQGQINLPLEELLKLTIFASKWACEQFELGRDQFRRQLYKEALQSVTRAIEGEGSNQGIKTEFRFHYLTGLIRLGSYRNSSPDLIKPLLARQAFLAAARCAEPTNPADAGLALICAGRAALVARDFEDAIAHTRKGLDFLPTHAAGMYQLGRALFLKGLRSEAPERLADAILLNVEHALHAAGDPDFIAKTDFLDGVLRQARERYEARYKQFADRYRRALQTLQDFSFMEVPADALQLKGIVAIKEIPKSAEATAASKTLFACSAAISQLLGGFRLFPAYFEEFKAHCIRLLQEKLIQPPRREDYLPANFSDDSLAGPDPSTAGLASGIISGIVVFVFESSQMARPIYRGLMESLSELFLIPLVAAVGIAATVTVLGDVYREYVRSKYKSALADFEAARHAHINLKNSLESEIESIRSMSLPREFAPPSQATAAKPGSPADASAAPKRVSAWAKI
ncbi:MAG: hypothetical protein NTY41_14210 [Proteobacteria bacterium]|nr:hypothetical protein [Pseudomonadota bacterium]